MFVPFINFLIFSRTISAICWFRPLLRSFGDDEQRFGPRSWRSDARFGSETCRKRCRFGDIGAGHGNVITANNVTGIGGEKNLLALRQQLPALPSAHGELAGSIFASSWYLPSFA